MKRIIAFALLCFGAYPLPAAASYYETWIVEGEVVEVYGEKETNKVLEKNKDLVAYKEFLGPNKEQVLEYYRNEESKRSTSKSNDLKLRSTFVGLKIRITKVTRKEGHGAMRKPKTGQDIDVVLNYDLAKAKGKFTKDMVLRMSYTYVNGTGPKGEVNSDHWHLVELLKDEDAPAKVNQ